MIIRTVFFLIVSFQFVQADLFDDRLSAVREEYGITTQYHAMHFVADDLSAESLVLDDFFNAMVPKINVVIIEHLTTSIDFTTDSMSRIANISNETLLAVKQEFLRSLEKEKVLYDSKSIANACLKFACNGGDQCSVDYIIRLCFAQNFFKQFVLVRKNFFNLGALPALRSFLSSQQTVAQYHVLTQKMLNLAISGMIDNKYIAGHDSYNTHSQCEHTAGLVCVAGCVCYICWLL